MMRRAGLLTILALSALAGSAGAQSTGMPAYYAPYRAFDRFEFGGTLSFPAGDLTGLEGFYSFGYKTWDVGFRGGALMNGDETLILGVNGRVRVLTHTDQFPLDGAVVVGVGTWEFDNLLVPVGISLGRRIDLENSKVSIVPFAQPTLFLNFDDNDLNDTAVFGLGLGADFRLSRMFDVRASFGIGDGLGEGFSVSAVWVR